MWNKLQTEPDIGLDGVWLNTTGETGVEPVTEDAATAIDPNVHTGRTASGRQASHGKPFWPPVAYRATSIYPMTTGQPCADCRPKAVAEYEQSAGEH